MKKFLFYLFSATILLVVGCSESFDDSEIWTKLNSLEGRIAALEQLCRQMNTNISSLQTVVDALKNNDYVAAYHGHAVHAVRPSLGNHCAGK